MHRPGCDPEDMHANDFACDFCGRTWEPSRPMVEGHRGSLMCGTCLSAAYRQVIALNQGVVVPEHVSCALCLLNKRGDYWQSPVRAFVVPADEPHQPGGFDVEPEPGACACRWCIERSAGMLEKDADSAWRRPG